MLGNPIVFQTGMFDSPDALIAEIRAQELNFAVVVDGASVPELDRVLSLANCEGHSLMAPPDEEILAGETPVLVPLAPEQTGLVYRLLDIPNAGFVCLGYLGEPARLIRHLRGWLSVRLPLDAPERTQEDKPVLFRFYDPRILALFLATLTPGEAAAFCGPVEVWGRLTPQPEFWQKTLQIREAQPAFRRPDLFRIRPEQYAVLAQHSVTTFETALATYLRAEFAAETEALDDASLGEIVDRAMEDGERLGDTRPGSIATLAVLHVLRPDLMRDRFVWAQVMGDNPEGQNPLQRVGLLSAYHTTDLPSIEAYNAYHARLDRFWEYY